MTIAGGGTGSLQIMTLSISATLSRGGCCRSGSSANIALHLSMWTLVIMSRDSALLGVISHCTSTRRMLVVWDSILQNLKSQQIHSIIWISYLHSKTTKLYKTLMWPPVQVSTFDLLEFVLLLMKDDNLFLLLFSFIPVSMISKTFKMI